MNKPVNINAKRKEIRDFYVKLLEVSSMHIFFDCYNLARGTIEYFYKNEDFHESDIHFDLLLDPEKAHWMPVEKVLKANKMMEMTYLYYNTKGFIYYPVRLFVKCKVFFRHIYHCIKYNTPLINKSGDDFGIGDLDK